MKLKPIQDQVVVIIGASSGIGRETALQFARRGAKVVAAGRSENGLNTLVEEIRKGGGEAVYVIGDVSQFDEVKAIAQKAVDTYGRIDTWVHLAATSIYATFEETTPEEFKRVIDVNLVGQAFGAMAALPHLKSEGRGALIHVSSVESQRSLPYQSAYSASKRGMAGFLESMRMELEIERIPISVTNIIPASINTPLFDKVTTKLGVKPAPIPPVYEPVTVARAILYASEHPVRELTVGGSADMLSVVERISPRLGDIMLRRMAARLQHSDEPKSAYAPSNLFKHLEGYDTVEGSYGKLAKPFSLSTWLQTHPNARMSITASTILGLAALPAVAIMFGVRSMRKNRKRHWLLRSLAIAKWFL